MEKELIINSTQKGVDIALLEDKVLVEYHQESNDSKFNVGDVYLAKIKKLIPGLNAAFINVGSEKDAFLHYSDLGPQVRSLMKFTRIGLANQDLDPLLSNFKFEKDILKTGKIAQVFGNKQPIIVQVLKEPISTKGPRLTCEISLAGKYLILTPFNNSIGVSKKINNPDDRKRLERLLRSITPKGFGVIVRTAARGKKVAELHEDLEDLLNKWKDIFKKLEGARAPQKLLSEETRITSILRDMHLEEFNNIAINDKALSVDLKSYIRKFSPEKTKVVNFHNGRSSIFQKNGITKQIKGSFGRSVTMRSGAYIVIEHTEALHVIDVNSGHKVSTTNTQEDNAIKVNIEAAKETARQLRLRDMGGLIIVDFIDMRNRENKSMLHKKMKEFMKNDKAKHTILPLSRFGLMQITRQRVRPELNIQVAESCPSCKGTGIQGPSILLVDDIERDLEFLLIEQNKKMLRLDVHPYIYSHIKKGLINLNMKWNWKFKRRIQVRKNTSFNLTEYRFYKGDGSEIELESSN